MIWTIARKEFLTSVLTLRFGVGLILCLTSATTGTLAVVEDLRSRQEAFVQAMGEYEEQLEKEGIYGDLVRNLKAFRPPSRLAVLSVGSDRWQGNQVTATHHFVPEDANWLGAANPYLAVFRTIDMALVVQFVLSLLALLFAYDAVCGEREDGTMKLLLANQLPRDQVLLGKAAGHMGILGMILLAGFLVSMLVVQASPGVVLQGDEVGRAAAILALSGLYLIAVYSTGLLLSTLSRHAVTALVLALVIWVSAVAIYPNAVAYAVDELFPMEVELRALAQRRQQLNSLFNTESRDLAQASLGVGQPGDLFGAGIYSGAENNVRGYVGGTFPTMASLESFVDRERNQIQEYSQQLRQQQKHNAAAALEAALRKDWSALARYNEDLKKEDIFLPDPMAEEELARRLRLLTSFFAARERLRIDLADRIWQEGWVPVEERQKRAASWGRSLGLLSPAGAYQQAAAILAGTDRGAYWRFLGAARTYRRQLIAHFEEEGYFSSREWFNDQAGAATLAALPRFQDRGETIWQSLGRARGELLVLAGFGLTGFMGAYWRFRRYDVT